MKTYKSLFQHCNSCRQTSLVVFEVFTCQGSGLWLSILALLNWLLLLLLCNVFHNKYKTEHSRAICYIHSKVDGEIINHHQHGKIQLLAPSLSDLLHLPFISICLYLYIYCKFCHISVLWLSFHR